MHFKQMNPKGEYIIDSFPVSIFDNIRISRCKIVHSEEFRRQIALKFELPSGCEVIADCAFTDYNIEDACQEESIKLNPQRKKNSQRGDGFAESIYKKDIRRKILSIFNVIKAKFPAHIHAVTLDGFLLKAFCFVFAYTLKTAFI